MVTGTESVGGLVGVNYGDGTIARCYAICTVQADGSGGGLVGENLGLPFWLGDGSTWVAVVSDCYSIVLGDSRVSGLLVGKNGRHPSIITNCYASCEGSEMVEASGMVGENVYGEVLNCFWDADACGLADSTEGGTPKTTADMQSASTFLDAGWDFVDESANGTEDIWWILDGQDYPRLWWERVQSDGETAGQ